MIDDTVIFERDVQEVKVTRIQPKGWYPIDIEYGLSLFGQSESYQLCWRIVNTQHIFRIPLQAFYEYAKGDYEGHFKTVLETFRIDYLNWYKQGFTEEWMQNYRRQFKNYIYTFE